MLPLQLSIIIPFYNEARTIPSLITKLHRTVPDAQIIFVDDGSTDASLALVRASARPHDLVLTKANGGKGSAVRMGLLYARSTYTLIQDADLEYDPNDIPLLLAYAIQMNADAVLGSRRLKKQNRSCDKWWYLVGGVLCTWCFNILYGQRLTDMHTCYKLVRTSVLQSLPLRQSGFGIDTEIITFLARKNAVIIEQGITYQPRSRADGKKITWKDFIHCLSLLFVLRFTRLASVAEH